MSAQQPPAELPEQEHTFNMSLCHCDTNKWSSWLGKACCPSFPPWERGAGCTAVLQAGRHGHANPYLQCNHHLKWVFCSLNFQSTSKAKSLISLRLSASILFLEIYLFFFPKMQMFALCCICVNKWGRWAFSFVLAGTTILQTRKKKWPHNWGKPYFLSVNNKNECRDMHLISEILALCLKTDEHFWVLASYWTHRIFSHLYKGGIMDS